MTTMASNPTAGPRKVLIVEDETLVANLLADSLKGAGFDTNVTKSVATARKALTQFDPDIALIDITLGHGPSGVELAYIMSQTHPATALIFLTKHPDLRTAGINEKDIPEGSGFLRKELISDTDYLVTSIEEIIHQFEADVRHDLDPSRPLSVLTDNQVEVLRMVAQGYTNTEIAKQRGISSSAVEQILGRIMRALDIGPDGILSQRVEVARVFIASAGLPSRPEA